MATADGGVTLARLGARRLRKLVTTPVTPELKEKASLAILDYLSSISAGLQAPWTSDVEKYAKAKDNGHNRGEAFTGALDHQVDAHTAAFCNTLLAHSGIRNDMHLPSNSHIGSMIISVALAVCQRDGRSGEDLLKAIIGGYEMSALLGTSFQQTEGYNRHMRSSGSCGAFGAAAAAVVANEDVDEDVATNALLPNIH